MNCVRTTCLFTSAYPAVLSASSASTLLPYLKSPTNPEEFVTSEYLLKTFRAAVPHMPKTAAQFGKELQAALQPMVIKPSTIGGRSVSLFACTALWGANSFPLKALPETVACMCVVVEHLTHDFARLAALLRSCNGKQSLHRCDCAFPVFTTP